MNQQSKYLLLVTYIISNLLLGCNFKSKSSFPVSTTQQESLGQEEVCQKLNWNQVKAGLKGDPKLFSQTDNIYTYLSYCVITESEAEDLIKIYRSSKTEAQKIKILKSINGNYNYNFVGAYQKLSDFYYTTAKSKNILLSSLAIRGLVRAKQVDQLLNIYKSKKDDETRTTILRAMAEYLETDDTLESDALLESEKTRIEDLYLQVAASNNPTLAPIALRGLTNNPLNKRWTSWGWSPEVTEILEQAVEKDFYKLSSLDATEMLALTNRYPNSQFTKSCIEYRKFTEGTYFGQSIGGWGSNQRAVFRQPFDPKREQSFWPQFLKKYPQHPGSDDAMYRLARSYEFEGNYEKAILLYDQASQAPDGEFSDVARERILFIIDLLLSSDSLEKIINNNPKHPLYVYLVYSKAIHLIREDNLDLAIDELEKFIKKYQKMESSKFTYFVENNIYLRDGSDAWRGSGINIKNKFFDSINLQVERLRKIQEIRKIDQKDVALYEEAAFWFNYDYLAYNHFWYDQLLRIFGRFIPYQWEGVTTSTENTITFDLVNAANENYLEQNRHLKSIELFEKLFKGYPESELAAEAKYSIGLNYYYLYGGGYLKQTDQELSWKELTQQSFREFVEEFPTSSMADDALLAIAGLSSDEEAVPPLEQILRDYPNGDRYEEAQARLKSTSSRVSSSRNNQKIYRRDLLPVGSYNFYEKGLRKNVSYIRRGNEMVGALYDPQQPNTVTCFTATLSKNRANVEWWGNLEQIGKSGQRINRSYSMTDFTVDNSTPRAGLDNPSAVKQCENG
ncbi:MAG: tetratricopeptide repeat protein [Symploca sp. SIO2D2]|nr:tetratricopeptide repeat protein [Symploca sp. SIO2D2]